MLKTTKLPMVHSIQLIRTFAAIGVMLSHIGFGDSYLTNISFSVGVNLFFCISGFLMMYTTQNTSQEKFAIKRLIRLLPLYWSLTILTFFASKLFDGFSVSDIGVDELIKSMLCIPYSRGGLKTDTVIRPIVGPAWTLGYDVWFVLIYSLSMKLSHKYRGILCSVACVLIVALGNLLPENPIVHFMGRYYWLNYVMGVLVFYIWKLIYDKIDLRKKLKPVCLIIIILAMFALYFADLSLPICIIVTFVAVSALIIGFYESRMPKLINNFGKISYSFYLTHYYVILILAMFINFNQLNIMTILGTVVAFALSLFTGYIGYYVFEKKFGSMLKKLFGIPS